MPSKMQNKKTLDEISNLYDKRIDQTSNAVDAAGQWESEDNISLICKEIDQKIKLKQSDNVLELGCGSGVLGKWISDRCNFYAGIDISSKMLQFFLKESNPSRSISLTRGLTNNVPYLDNYFDIVIMNGVTMYFKNNNQLLDTLNEIKRVIKKDGTIFIGENITPNNLPWELVWFQNLSPSLQTIAKIYIKIRKYFAKKNSKLAGKWNSIHKEIQPDVITNFFKEIGDVTESKAASYVVKKKAQGKNYKGNRRVDFVVNLH